jgi:DNA-binding MarR family transcriptional regulator
MIKAGIYEFADRMNEIMPIIMREFARRQADELYKGKITLPQLLILDFLNNQSESNMTDLAHFMRVSTAAMTGIIDRLVKYGYVLRSADSDDRRIIRIKLTPGGQELLKKINQQRRQMIIKIFDKLSEGDRKDYLRILMQIKDILARGRIK